MWVAGALAVIAVTFAWAGSLALPSVRVQVGGYDRAPGWSRREFGYHASTLRL